MTQTQKCEGKASSEYAVAVRVELLEEAFRASAADVRLDARHVPDLLHRALILSHLLRQPRRHTQLRDQADDPSYSKSNVT